ncbi:MAG: ABC transporter permease, partial [bacterium]|nr:ABC transporter permease [bacterium]
MRNVITMAIKDLRLLFRDKFGLFWVLAFPLLMALLFGSIYSGGGGSTSAIKIAVADEDSTNGSRAYIEELSNSDALNVVEMSKEEAIEKVRKGKITAYIVLQKGFGATGGFSMFGGESPPMEVGMDPSRKAEAGYLQGILTQATFKRMQNRFMSPDSALNMVRDGLESVEESDDMIPEQQKNLLSYLKNTEDFLGAVDSSVYAGGGVSQMKEIDIKPVERENKDRPHSAFEITFPSAILWALIGCAAAFGISIVQERTRGTFLRLQLAPLSRLQILAGKGLACFITCMGVSALLLIIGNLGFNVRLENFA